MNLVENEIHSGEFGILVSLDGKLRNKSSVRVLGWKFVERTLRLLH